MRNACHQRTPQLGPPIWLRCLAAAFVFSTASVTAAPPNPILNSVFPPGGTVGETVEVTIAGSALGKITSLQSTASGLSFESVAGQKNLFRVRISADTPVGFYDLRIVGNNGISSPRPFIVGNRPEQLEPADNDHLSTAPTVRLNSVVNGRIEQPGDVDYFRFEAKRGQHVVVECLAERIDSNLRAVLELFDEHGRHLFSNRGYFGVDPLIDFRVPADATYLVKIYDLTFAGSADHYYRLDIDTGPRVAFTTPTVVQQGQPARVTLHGWNLTADSAKPVDPVNSTSVALGSRSSEETAVAVDGPSAAFDQVEVEIPADQMRAIWPLPVHLQPAQVGFQGWAYHFPGSHAPVAVSVTDVPVVMDTSPNHTPETARHLNVPGEVSGQLAFASEQDWYTFDARRGEILYLEGFAQRLNSPVDLDLRVLDVTGTTELVRFGDERKNTGGKSFPTHHLDPAGRLRVPADGRYLLLVRNLTPGSRPDSRRTYRVSIRREEPDFAVGVIPHRADPAGINVTRGGRMLLDLIALRQRGLTGNIRVSAANLPAGINCPDVWLGPGIDRAPLVISAEPSALEGIGNLNLEASAESAGKRQVRGGVVVRSGTTSGWGRLTSQLPVAIAGTAPIQITADGHEMRDHHLFGRLQVRHSPGGVLDVAIHVQRADAGYQAEIKLTGVGMPGLIANQAATIPAGNNKGYISFYLPPELPVGRYSLAIQAETTVPISSDKTEAVTIVSNPVNFEVHPPAFRLQVDQFAPQQIKRGQVLKINYSAERLGGFINKIHTELAQPGKVTDVIGLRGRGVTFVGQTDSGTIQIIANDDAPLGQQPFLRLYGVGVLEDEPRFHGSCLLNLEVTE